jgi:hypothetical protein
MKRIILSTLIAFGLVEAATAQTFQSQSELTNYWTANSGAIRTQIFLNGYKVLDRPGFGPAYVLQYFACSQTSDIREECSSIADGSTSLQHLLGLVPTATVLHNGVLVQTAEFPVIGISTCTGESSGYGPVHYEKMTYEYSGFGGPQELFCY